MSATEVKVPDIGDFEDVEVIEVLVQPGDRIEKEQSLVTVESDKASMEIPSSVAGTVTELRVKVGDKVSEGSLLVLVDAAAESAADGSAADASAADASAPAAGQPDAAAPTTGSAGTQAPGLRDAGAQADTSAATASVEVKVPDIGDFKDVEVIEVLVQPGDRVEAEQSLITVESDKASMEIPSSAAGEIAELRVKVGDKVNEGSLIAVLKAAGAATAGGEPAAATRAAPAQAAPAEAPAGQPAAGQAADAASERPVDRPPSGGETLVRPPSPTASLDVGGADTVKPHASPSVRKFARELGVDLGKVRGTGPKQRILHEDVRNWVKGVIARADGSAAAPAAAAGGDAGAALGLIPWPKVDFAKFGPVETRPVARIRKISAANLHRNWVMIPHVTNHDEADITELEAFRVQLNQEQGKGGGVKVTMLAFLIKAWVNTLQAFPEFNSSLDGETLVLKNYWHIGFAADTPNGLMVPVIRDADKKGIFQIAKETSELAAKAREGKLSPSEMQGGTFSISSLGGIGGTSFTPIINAPEVAILGVCRSFMKPVWDGKGFHPRLILPLSLSWDHRVVDGAAAARFNVHLARLLADFRRVML
ncbi:MAG: dihydrolipoyllysine-residue acetyltransferase [Limnobacter sp.]|nr:dihydrolipoyllysine-residue acetyltransferase [Limnobacter sp.]